MLRSLNLVLNITDLGHASSPTHTLSTRSLEKTVEPANYLDITSKLDGLQDLELIKDLRQRQGRYDDVNFSHHRNKLLLLVHNALQTRTKQRAVNEM